MSDLSSLLDSLLGESTIGHVGAGLLSSLSSSLQSLVQNESMLDSSLLESLELSSKRLMVFSASLFDQCWVLRAFAVGLYSCVVLYALFIWMVVDRVGSLGYVICECC